jgi:undecaprenyl-diphosphatase
MDIVQSIILGIVQGLGEFLPISSTAHLVLVPFFTGWEDPGLSFDVALHAGTLIAVLLFFWSDWLDIFRTFFDKNFSSEKYKRNILPLIVAATIPGALIGYFLEDLAASIFRSPWIIAFSLSFFGFVLYIFDKYMKEEKEIKEIGWKESLIIGLAQAVAIIPGVSRSGATITASRALGMDRVSAARFSFLLSTPIICGATLTQIPSLIENGVSNALFVGVLVAAVSGYVAIKYMIRFVEKYSYKVFFWYRLVLAGVIVLTVLYR